MTDAAPAQTIAAETTATFERLCRALAETDHAAVGALLTEDFACTHLSGYVQSRDDFITQLGAASLNFSAVDVVKVEPLVDGEAPVLLVATLTDATLLGAADVYRLRWRVELAPDGAAAGEGTSGTGWRVARVFLTLWDY